MVVAEYEVYQNERKYKVVKHDNRTEYFNEAGQLHREDGPAIESESFSAYYQFGLRHRPENEGPAFQCEGLEEYWHFGKLHRTTGPAHYCVDKDKEFKQYWIKGMEYSESDFLNISHQK